MSDNTKLSVSHGAPMDDDALASLLNKWAVPRQQFPAEQLSGGYSGSSYMMRCPGIWPKPEECWVLRLCHAYTIAEAAGQAHVMAHLARRGFGPVPVPKIVVFTTHPEGGRFILEHKAYGEEPVPVMCLQAVDGAPADKAVAAGEADAKAVLRGAGRYLAAMHTVSVVPPKKHMPKLRTSKQGGAVDMRLHANGDVLKKMQACERVRDHPFLAFYRERFKRVRGLCRRAMGRTPQGIIHGDPWLDNMLVDKETKEFAGMVDFEDACVGSMVFDVAACVVGTCFPDRGSTHFDVGRMQALLQGYRGVRRLRPGEKGQLWEFVWLALMLNATWRFVNFNVDHPEVEEAREEYAELMARVEAVEEGKMRRIIGWCGTMHGGRRGPIRWLFSLPGLVAASIGGKKAYDSYVQWRDEQAIIAAAKLKKKGLFG